MNYDIIISSKDKSESDITIAQDNIRIIDSQKISLNNEALKIEELKPILNKENRWL